MHKLVSKLVPTWFLPFLWFRLFLPTSQWFLLCSHAHALFQDRFKDVQVGSRWCSTLYILSPNFHTEGKHHNSWPRMQICTGSCFLINSLWNSATTQHWIGSSCFNGSSGETCSAYPVTLRDRDISSHENAKIATSSRKLRASMNHGGRSTFRCRNGGGTCTCQIPSNGGEILSC